MVTNKRALVIFFFSLLGANLIYAQQNFNGHVFDEAGNPLPFATVYLEGQNCGSLTDEMGAFTFSCNDKASDSSTLVVLYLGYVTQRIDLLRKTQGLSVSLANDAITLATVEVTATEGVQNTFEFIRKKPDFYYQTNVETNYQLAIEVRNDNHKGGLLNEIQFFVGKAASNSIPVRLSFYATDEDCDCPGAAMHAKNIFVQAKSKRNKVDLRPYNIELPPGNFFVAFEWLPTPDRRQGKLDFSIGMVSAAKQTSLQERRGGLGWQKKGNSGRQHILVEIDYLKF